MPQVDALPRDAVGGRHVGPADDRATVHAGQNGWSSSR
jgi:hypothetical protein